MAINRDSFLKRLHNFVEALLMAISPDVWMEFPGPELVDEGSRSRGVLVSHAKYNK